MRTIEETIAEILSARGIAPGAETEEYFSQKPKLTFDPFLLPDMREGAGLLLSALEEGRNICVYGDYDADGTLAAALLVRWLRGLPGKSRVFWHIPLRVEEGYGLNRGSIKAIREKGADVIVSVDCGSSSADEAEYARSLGMEMIITDHHDCAEGRAPDCIFINPKRSGSKYPFGELSGCGVAFKLAQAMCRLSGPGDRALSKRLNSFLDIVAVATVADVTPLVSENRTIVKYGLSMLRQGDRPAFKKLIPAIGIDRGRVSAYNIGFGIGPHINSAGRMSDAGKIVELFVTDDEYRMDDVIGELIKHNLERRLAQEEAFEECSFLAERADDGQKLLIIKPDSIHEGIAGIVAGKIKERFGRPAIILSKTPEGSLKGSARSIGRLSIIELLREEEGLFKRFGGHAMAAGFTLPAENEGALRANLEKRLRGMLEEDPGLFMEEPAAEAELAPGDATMALAERLQDFEPIGLGNPRPFFLIRDAEISSPRTMGDRGRHMRFSTHGLECVLFGRAAEFRSVLVSGARLGLMGNLEINEWNGSRSPRFLVRSIIQ